MKSTKLSKEQKEYLWKEISRYSNTLEEPISEYIGKVIYEKCIPGEFKTFLDNPECEKMCIRTYIVESLKLKDIGLGETVYKPDENCLSVQISTIYFRILDFPQYKKDNIDVVKEFLRVCTENELDTLRNLVMNYIKFEYKMLNRFNKYLSYPELACDRGFLENVNTWEELRGINEDWYNIVYEKFKKEDTMIMTGMALEDKIKNLRNIIDI